jgi:lipoprotein-anchoring transpeptidase ErfK/SrfK
MALGTAFGLMFPRVSLTAACAMLALMLASFSDVSARTPRHARSAGGATLTPDAIENAQWSGSLAGKSSPIVLKAEVLLDRAKYSPGEIDGRDGENFKKALLAYQQHNELNPTGKLDQATWDALVNASGQPVLQSYTIAAADEQGPFVDRIPQQYDEMAQLKRLGYRSPRQLLAEKFHMSEDILTRINPGASFDREGTQIIVVNVTPIEVVDGLAAKDRGNSAEGARAERVEVDKRARVVRALGPQGQLLAFYPASIGSTEKPAPSGHFTVRSVSVNPTYRYDPKYAFKGQRTRSPVTIAPGPKNPVGLAWIDLSASSYGIHGTPAPQNVSKTESHGCIRLTNWDALALAKLVRKGTPVDFID